MWNDNEKTGRRSLSRPRPESRAGRFCCGRPRRSKRRCPSIRCWVASSATVYDLDQGTARTSTPHGRAHVASLHLSLTTAMAGWFRISSLTSGSGMDLLPNCIWISLMLE